MFDNLLQTTDVDTKPALPDWTDDIPEHVFQAAQKIVGKAQRVTVHSSEQAVQTKAVLKAALAKIAPDKAAHFRDVYDKETGALTGFTVSAGAPRGRKPKSD